jgi:hypothetical protein
MDLAPVEARHTGTPWSPHLLLRLHTVQTHEHTLLLTFYGNQHIIEHVSSMNQIGIALQD